MGLSWLFLLVSAHSVLSATEYFDSFTGLSITEEEYNAKVATNASFTCMNAIETCDETEGRRLDGSCNNLNFPSRGALFTPNFVLLPKVFTDYDQPRLSVSGEPLPLARELRTSIMANGRVPDTKFNQMVANFLVFVHTDLVSGEDTANYVFSRNCCANPTDPECTVQEVPEDDPVFRFSGLRCMNMTKPWTFQHVGCEIESDIPQRITTELPLFDLSNFYGTDINSTLDARLFENGMLKYEELFGKHWPPNNPEGSCTLNRADLNETRCHDGPGSSINFLVGANMFHIWFWRNHNYIAGKLAELNSCWDDETLFETARDINIASYSQIIHYDIFPTLMGEERMINDSVIIKDGGFRDTYNETVLPSVGMEMNTVLRWIHTIQEGTLKLYEPDGTVVDEIPYVELTLRTGWLANNNKLALLTQGALRQPSAAFDQVVDPDVGQWGVGPLQEALDLLTNDLAKNRYFGHAPYVDYVNFCEGTNKSFTSFDDLADHIEPEMLQILSEVYEDVNDIDLQAGLWSEKKVEGGYVPKTFYCITANYLKRSMSSDRHWYERQNRPKAFSIEQLAEIRKVTLASLMCLHGDTVTEIQSKAFELISESNPLVNCSSIPTIDFSVWVDQTCIADDSTVTNTTTTASITTRNIAASEEPTDSGFISKIQSVIKKITSKFGF